MATPYERGRSFEYRVRNHLQSLGYLVARSPASRGPFDLIAVWESSIGPGVALVQCKLAGKISKKELAELVALAKTVGAESWLAYPGANRRGVELVPVTE